MLLSLSSLLNTQNACKSKEHGQVLTRWNYFSKLLLPCKQRGDFGTDCCFVSVHFSSRYAQSAARSAKRNGIHELNLVPCAAARTVRFLTVSNVIFTYEKILPNCGLFSLAQCRAHLDRFFFCNISGSREKLAFATRSLSVECPWEESGAGVNSTVKFFLTKVLSQSIPSSMWIDKHFQISN